MKHTRVTLGFDSETTPKLLTRLGDPSVLGETE